MSNKLVNLTGAEVKVWIGTGNGDSQKNESYISYDPFDLFHLKGMTLNGGDTLIDLQKIELLDYYNFGKILDRADVGSKLSYSERNHLFFAHLCFWHDIIIKNSIDLIIFSNIPHTPDSYGLFVSAKVLNIKTITVNVTPLPGIIYLTGAHTETILSGHSYKSEIFENYKTLHEFSSNFFLNPKSELWYMKMQREQEVQSLTKIINTISPKHWIRKSRKYLKSSSLNTGEKKYRSIKRYEGLYDGKSKSTLRELLVKTRWVHYRYQLEKELKSCEVSKIPEKFLYFPLHYQPEATTAPGSGFFSDQHVLVDLITNHLPEDVFLVIKEHPTQLYRKNWGISGRSLGYWKKITRNKKVILVDRGKNSKELIEKSIGVVTGTGTAGYEAIVQGKTALVFGRPWYLHHPRAIETNFSNVGKVIKLLTKPKSDRPNALIEAENEEFLRIASKFLIKCDVHGYTKGQVERDPEYLAQVIFQHVD